MIIKSVNNKQVYDPDNGDYLPTNGRNVEFNQYWARRLTNNDVEEVTNIKVKQEKKVAKNDN
ncbi:hypothetical protein A9G24_08440 [Gilliamella sp. App6-5]|jgi:hypothetical protein|uniref:DUF2635 domain-containing protein n=1 Tax=Gilliamella sp. App6-5 TaxID=3120232 RepID=UPI00080ED313|nr:DUF2635 domain-containing protein [Gilliamella apicola]OCG12816.1 hypothetical protein A9G24_08440 [Gilliamella apicola]